MYIAHIVLRGVKVKMKVKKKSICLVLAFIMTVLLTGCMGVNTKVTMKEDGSGTLSYCVMIDSQLNEYMKTETEEDHEEEFKKMGYTESQQIYDNNIYICFEKCLSFATPKELCDLLTEPETFSNNFLDGKEVFEDYEDFQDSGAIFSNAQASEDSFQAVMLGDGIMLDEEKMNAAFEQGYFVLFSITYGKEIVYTNGTLSADKKTASWKLGFSATDKLIQVSTKGASEFSTDTVKPVIKGVKNEKYYNTYVDITVSDDIGIESVTCNDEAIGKEESIELDGKYTITAKDFAGNTSKVTFYVDTTYPSVKGVKNGATYKSKRTIKFTDTIGVKSATLNGKKIKSGKVVSKKGKYTLRVTDMAGNVRVVKFQIKK